MYVGYITRGKWVPQNITRALRALVVCLAEPTPPRDVTCTNPLPLVMYRYATDYKKYLE